MVKLPCLISVDKDSFIPRVPSLKNKIESRKKIIKCIGLEYLKNKDASFYGINGSATSVVRTYPFYHEAKSVAIEVEAMEASKIISDEIYKINGGNYIE